MAKMISMTPRDAAIVQRTIDSVAGRTPNHLPPMLNLPRFPAGGQPDPETGYGLIQTASGSFNSQEESVNFPQGDFISSDGLASIVSGVAGGDLGSWEGLRVQKSGTYLMGYNVTCEHPTTWTTALKPKVFTRDPPGILIAEVNDMMAPNLANGDEIGEVESMVDDFDHLIKIKQCEFWILKNGGEGEGASDEFGRRQLSIIGIAGRQLRLSICYTVPIETDAGDVYRLVRDGGFGSDSSKILFAELWIASQGPSFEFTGEADG